MFEHEPIKGVDLSVLHNLTEVYLGLVYPRDKWVISGIPDLTRGEPG